MEIITKKHWLGWNTDDKEVFDWARKSSDENFKIYAERLEKLRPRLKERNYEFFKKGLHDGRLIAFSVGEGLYLDFESNLPLTLRNFSKTSVSMKVINGDFDAVYDLKYERVSKAVFDFPSESPLWGNSIDDWGYDELSEVDEKILKHEVLFSSGTTILIEFEKFSFKKKKYKGSR
ncbi:MAG TPA: hypothetical protein PKE69_24445 [Pyrinomonadaceae bacterium]|nr:hypothetical protein [Pyrinomonadaceae bacterium]